jgi:hypothetical protein
MKSVFVIHTASSISCHTYWSHECSVSKIQLDMVINKLVDSPTRILDLVWVDDYQNIILCFLYKKIKLNQFNFRTAT